IEPGKPILEIVPLPDDLVIEARVRSRDIDQVQVGQKADIRLTALNQRTTPVAHGRVIYVSATPCLTMRSLGKPRTAISRESVLTKPLQCLIRISSPSPE